jgi:ABC-type enterochelin transport system ATPase subunit
MTSITMNFQKRLANINAKELGPDHIKTKSVERKISYLRNYCDYLMVRVLFREMIKYGALAVARGASNKGEKTYVKETLLIVFLLLSVAMLSFSLLYFKELKVHFE